MTLAFRVAIGRQVASSRSSETDLALLTLRVRLDMLGAGGCCHLRLAQTGAAPITVGDQVRVELNAGEGMEPVFSGKVEQVLEDVSGLELVAYDSLRPLAGMELEGCYEGVRADQVIRDLLRRGGVSVGTVAPGALLARLRLRRPPSVLAHVQRLVRWCGADLHTDGAGRAQVTTAAQVRQRHAVHYTNDLLRLALHRQAALSDGLVVDGEGAAGSRGAGKEHWLPKEVAGVRGEAAINTVGEVVVGQRGQRPRRRGIGALGSASAAADVAAARLRAIANRPWQGELLIRGNPALLPGDQISLAELPADHPLSAELRAHPRLRLRGVTHSLSRAGAFTTRLEV